jgi:glycogen synthase
MNTVSRSFLSEIVNGTHPTSHTVISAARSKLEVGKAHGIPNSLPKALCPKHDPYLSTRYEASNHTGRKRENKRALQRMLGLEEDLDAPLLFWPSRLDPMQKGCQLLSEILYQVVSDYSALGLQVVFVADGPYLPVFKHIAAFHGLQNRIAVKSFSESLSRMGYAASDFTLMPSAYEPCGLSQMIGLRYGSLPIVHATGGRRDTVEHLDSERQTGNGFAFNIHDSQGLRWAIDEAMRFYIQPQEIRNAHITKIMLDAEKSFSPSSMVDQYLQIYKSLLNHRITENPSSRLDA